MGKLKGIVQITGQLDGLSFYEMRGKIIVRRTGGFDGKSIKTKENYVRTRENADEFGSCASLGKQFRMALQSYLKKIKMPYMHNHVLALFSKLLKSDAVSERGKRKVSVGVSIVEGKQLLMGFEFNKNVSLSQMVNSNYWVSMVEGKLVFSDFSVDQILFPEASTHISLQFLFLRFDFESGNSALHVGEKVMVSKNDIIHNLELTAGIPDGEGALIGLVSAVFMQQINNEFYELEGSALRIVGIV